MWRELLFWVVGCSKRKKKLVGQDDDEKFKKKKINPAEA